MDLVNEEGEVKLARARHAAFLRGGLEGLPGGFTCLDASRPWLAYWIAHSLSLLGELEEEGGGGPGGGHAARLVSTLARAQSAAGGFGGGPLQLAHCAPTYAAVLTLLLIGTEEAYQAIDRPKLYQWFMAMKHESGGFRMHDDGEVDVRGTYTVVAVAALLNLLTPELREGVAEFAASCQTTQGAWGRAGHGGAARGYVFCGLAALALLGRRTSPTSRPWSIGSPTAR
ncbi:unnamed protein product [Heterosigma akashiwo]